MGNWKSHEKQSKEANDLLVPFPNPSPEDSLLIIMFTYKILIFYTMFTCAYKHIYIHTHKEKLCILTIFEVFVYHMCVWSPRRPEEGAVSPVSGVIDGCEPTCGCQILLSTEPSPAPAVNFFLKIILYVLSSTNFLIQQYTSESFLNNRNEQVHLPQ